MIIGVDAGALSVTDERLKVGVYRVTYNVLKELAAIDKKNAYRLYSFRPIDSEVMAAFGQRMNNVVLWPARGWFSVRLPLELAFHPVDVFLGFSQAIPATSAYTIGYIHDLAFLHFPDMYPESLRKLKAQTDRIIRRANAIITVSHATKEDILRTYPSYTKDIAVAHSGVDARFTPNGPRINGNHPYVLFVGSLKKQKNIPGILRAFSLFLKKSRVVHDLYIVGGDYWKDTEIDLTLDALNLGNRVKMLGFVPDETLPSYYRGAVCLVTPSLWEGFCLPAIEAAACGCPVVGATNSAFLEIVADTGLLVNPNDVEQIAHSMYDMATKARVRRQCIARGLKRSRRFRWVECAKIVYHAIEKTHYYS